jgi:hypothetical protein
MLVKVQIPHEAGNKGVRDGSLPKVLEGFIRERKPEAAYFLSENGVRTALFVIDMKHSSDLPSIAEPFFQAFNADVSATPAMNADDLKAGIEKAAK